MSRNLLIWVPKAPAPVLLVLLVVILVLTPILGYAQGGEEDERMGVQGASEPSTLLGTDDPQGRNLIPVAQAETADVLVEERLLAASMPPSKFGIEGDLGEMSASAPEVMMSPEDERAMAAQMPPSKLSNGEFDVAEDLVAQSDVGTQAYVSPLVIPAAEFAYSGVGSPYNFTFTGGYVYGGYSCGMAPLYLPHGAKVQIIAATLYDNSDPDSVRIYVYRVHNSTGIVQQMGYVSTLGLLPSTSLRFPYDDTIDYSTINYPDYSYYAYGCMDSNQTRIYSLRVYYE